MTPYQSYLQRWDKCQRCDLCAKRNRVVHIRGKLPADVLFIGEAPGASEDVTGRPFDGPAGRLLDQIIQVAVPPEIRYAITNVIGCVPPKNPEGYLQEPPKYAIEACANRLKEVAALAKPRLVVLVGGTASKAVYGQACLADNPEGNLSWLPSGRYLRFVEIMHPAAILRKIKVDQGLLIQRAIVTIEDRIASLGESSEIPF